jgi:hypothetical protein
MKVTGRHRPMNRRLVRGYAVVATTVCMMWLLLGCHGTNGQLGGDWEQPPGRSNPALEFVQRLIGEWKATPTKVAESVWDTDHVSFREVVNSVSAGGAVVQIAVSETGKTLWDAPGLGPLCWSGDLVIDAVLGDSAQGTVTVGDAIPAVSEYLYVNRWTYPRPGNTCAATLTFSETDSRLNMKLVGTGAGWPDKYGIEMVDGPENSYVLRRAPEIRRSDPLQEFIQAVVGAWEVGLIKEPDALACIPEFPAVMTLSEVNTCTTLIPGTGGELNYLWEENSHRHAGSISIVLACGHSANVIVSGGGWHNLTFQHPGLMTEGTMSVSDDGDSLTISQREYDGSTIQWLTRR